MSGLLWNVALYRQFAGLRLRPALDLLGRVVEAGLPFGPVVDLGCGSGAALSNLAEAFPERRLIGLDRDPAMLEAAREAHPGLELVEVDISAWEPAEQPAVIFSNAVLHWLPDHQTLLPQLLSYLAPGGVLAVQMPRQTGEPSHTLLKATAERLYPGRLTGDLEPLVHDPAVYSEMLPGAAALDIWETVYFQNLPPSESAHPVRRFTQSSAARPYLAELSDDEAAAFLSAYDAALEEAYPRREDGSVLMPMRRLFLLAIKPFDA